MPLTKTTLNGAKQPLRAAILSLLVVLGLVVSNPSQAAALSGPYRIRTADAASRCLDVTGVSQANGAHLQLYDCLPYQYNQQFTLYAISTPGGTGYQIRAAHSGKCLDVEGVSMAPGARIQQYDCLGQYQTNQLFLKVYAGNGMVKFQAVHSGLCIQFVGNYNGAQIIQGSTPCSNSWQAWTLQNWN